MRQFVRICQLCDNSNHLLFLRNYREPLGSMVANQIFMDVNLHRLLTPRSATAILHTGGKHYNTGYNTHGRREEMGGGEDTSFSLFFALLCTLNFGTKV